MLSRYDGDVERMLLARPMGPISFEGKVLRSRRALADYLAPHLHRPVRAVEALLIYCGDDDKGVPVVKLVAPERT